MAKQLKPGQWYTLAAVFPEINESDIIRLFKESCGISLKPDQIRINFHRNVGCGPSYGATVVFTKANVRDMILHHMRGECLYGVPVTKLSYPMCARAFEMFCTND